jgi:hypothetical protein
MQIEILGRSKREGCVGYAARMGKMNRQRKHWPENLTEINKAQG